MSSLTPLNPLKKLTMNDFRAWNSVYGGLAKSCRFAVRFNPSKYHTQLGYGELMKQFTYLCEAVEMPGRGFLSLDVRYYGPNQKLPFQTQYEDMTLTLLCRSESYERQFFDDWMEVINPTNTYDFNFREDYESTIDIIQFAEYAENRDSTASGGTGGPNQGLNQSTNQYPKETYRITLLNAYPTLINPQPMTWADDQMQRLAVTFTYHKWRRVNYDKTITSNPDLVSGRRNIYDGVTLT